MLKLVKFINENENWEELLQEKPYCLKISRDDGYIMFKYSQIDSDFQNEIVRECRGIILKEEDFKPVCVPFYKFGNYGESYCPMIHWENCSVQQKVDGSLMKVWYDKTWHISTNGTIDAFKASLSSTIVHSFGELFIEALKPAGFNSFEEFTTGLSTNFTYMFELVSPENRVVIPYPKTELYFLGIRDINTLQEYKPEYYYIELGNYPVFKIPERYPLKTLEDIKAAANALPWDEEGYVVCDDCYNRVKIKSPLYVEAHYARTNGCINYERLVHIILLGEKEEFLIYASDYREKLEDIERYYNDMVNQLKDTMNELNPNNFETRKDFALEVLKKPRWMQPFLFKYGDVDEMARNTTPEKWVTYMEDAGYISAK